LKQWKEDEVRRLEADFSELKRDCEMKASRKAKEEIQMVKEKLNTELEATKQKLLNEEQNGYDVS